MIRDEFSNKAAFMTEFSVNSYDWFKTALMINQNLIEANASVYLYWTLMWNGDGDCMVRVNADGSYTVNPTYYSVQHFAKYIDKGYIRIDVQNQNPNIELSAFKHPTENKITYIIINRNNNAVDTELGLEDFDIQYSTILQSVDGNYGQQIGSLTGNVIILPARSITTIEIEYEKSTAVKDTPAMIQLFSLEQNYPNPFNPQTIIEYALSKPGFVTLTVYNILGQFIEIIDKGYKASGNHIIIFNAEDYTSGIYYYELSVGNVKKIKSMLLTK
jgi:hypothetical protein